MADMPKRVFADREDGCWSSMDYGRGDTAYVRADIADDLLAACHKVVNNWGNLHHKDLTQLRSAIAKAEGK